jgi:hypothetical protein
MDIIPHAGPIGRGVVVAEDADVLALAEGRLVASGGERVLQSQMPNAQVPKAQVPLAQVRQ